MMDSIYQPNSSMPSESMLPYLKTICYRIILPGVLIVITGQMTWNMYNRMQLKLKLQRKKRNLQTIMDGMMNNLENKHCDSSLINLDLAELQQKLRNKELEPVTLLHAYQAKALELYGQGNSGVCELITEAEQLAIGLTLSPDPDTKPLYGIPISLNEACAVQGYDSTFGLVKCCNNPNLEDCVIVQVLKSLGAIPFVLTMTSQAALSLSGHSPIFGNCFHPCSIDHQPGGSSCGEGVFLALKGSPVGLATDVAGSIRVTASFCGLSGLKPTSCRISSRGLAKFNPKQYHLIPICVGPIGRKTDDLVILTRALLQPKMFNLDPYVPPLKFDQQVFEGLNKPKLRIGFYDTLDSPDLMQTVPSIRRAIRDTAQSLTRMGHELIEFKPPRPAQAFQIALKLLNAHGIRVTQSALYGEPLSPDSIQVSRPLNMPHFVRRFVDYLVKLTFGKPAALVSILSGPGNLDNALKLLDDAKCYTEEFKQAWDDAGGFDAVICPTQATPAPPESAPMSVTGPGNVYVVLYNLLDYPAGTVCVSHVNKEDIQEAEKLYNQSLNYSMSPVQKELLSLQKCALGLPIGVQVVGRPFGEETVLRVMRELESHSSSGCTDEA